MLQYRIFVTDKQNETIAQVTSQNNNTQKVDSFIYCKSSMKMNNTNIKIKI